LICLIQIEGEQASRLSKKRLEREKARRDAAADLSEDLSEGEKGGNINESSVHDESTRGRMPRIGSTDAIEVWANQHKDKKLYIVLVRYESNSIPASLLLDGSVIPDSNRHLHFL
jgi:sucrose-phosphate synthase